MVKRRKRIVVGEKEEPGVEVEIESVEAGLEIEIQGHIDVETEVDQETDREGDVQEPGQMKENNPNLELQIYHLIFIPTTPSIFMNLLFPQALRVSANKWTL